MLEKSIEDIKDEDKLLDASNKYMKEQIDLLEEDSDEESDSGDVKKSDEEEPHKTDIKLKCVECDFVVNTHVSSNNHVNTRHALLVEPNKQELYNFCVCIEDFFP